MKETTSTQGHNHESRLFVYNLGFLFQPRLRKFLKPQDLEIGVGLPFASKDSVAVWGRRPV